MKIEITKNQLNSLVDTSGTGEFIAEQIGGLYDRFYIMTRLIDKISIFSDLEWEKINCKNNEGKILRSKLKKYIEKKFPNEECYCLTYKDELHMILAVNFYKNKSGCIPFFDNEWDTSYSIRDQDVYYLLIHTKDYLK